jgi:photoactive yellow protein
MQLSFGPDSISPASFRIEDIDTLADAQLDAAPFGIICLDAEGTVLRYNLYEARLARLDANQVLGCDFFTEIARCTRGPGFEGHFRNVVSGVATEEDFRFTYVFDFSFGAQEVGVEIVAFAEVQRFYLLINRRSVQLPRVEATDLGTLQAELAPLEHEQGVRRDGLERRHVDVPIAFFTALRATFSKVAPEAWPTFAHEWGVQWGRRAAIDLEGLALEQNNQTLSAIPMKDLLAGEYFDTRGWGKLAFDFAAIRDGLFELALARSALAEAVPGASAQPTCALIGGAAAGLFGHVANKRLVAREVACAAKGAKSCIFFVVATERANTLDELIALHGASPNALRQALRGKKAT